MTRKESGAISSGIDELVRKLKSEGIDAGQEQGSALLAKAEKKAAEILQQAEIKAKALLEDTRRQIEIDRRAADEAVKIAFRDLVLDMKNRMLKRLSDSFSRQVDQAIDDPKLIEKLILEAATKIVRDNKLPDTRNAEILLPEKMLQLQDIKQNPEQASNDELSQLVSSLRQTLLQQGIELNSHSGNGIRVRLSKEDIDVDITDKAIADLLLDYLQPRFLALFDGVIR
jgi:V/A-type H+-transporting ATPase subunit E